MQEVKPNDNGEQSTGGGSCLDSMEASENGDAGGNPDKLIRSILIPITPLAFLKWCNINAKLIC